MTPDPAAVSSIQHLDGRIDDTARVGTPTDGERAVPYHCPYCAEEDLRPLGATPGAWHCRTCTRSFSVKYLGMAPPTPAWPDSPAAAPTATATPTPTGGTR
jgi:hypothetical protein